MGKLQIALEKIEQKALDKIKRKIIAYNKKKGETKYFDIALPLKDGLDIEIYLRGSYLYIDSVKLWDDKVHFLVEGNSYDLDINQIIEIADSL